MKKARYSESQIVKALKEVEGGRNVNDMCRDYGISEANYYNRRTKYGGMEASYIKWLKKLEDENRRLKQMLTLHIDDLLSPACQQAQKFFKKVAPRKVINCRTSRST